MVVKYCEILDEEKGLVILGAGCTDEYYEEIGMKKRDVRQSDIDFNWYLYDLCPMKTEEQKRKEKEEYEKMRRMNANMTKYDFFKKVLAPNGIDYTQLNKILATNEDYKIAWDLCERVYREDEILVGAVKKFIPKLTDEELDRIFGL